MAGKPGYPIYQLCSTEREKKADSETLSSCVYLDG